MPVPPLFRLRTLGTLRLFAPDGREEPLLANRRQKLALLAVLAISRRAISRDRLADLFWGERSEERARHSLSDALSQLRRVLGSRSIRARQSEIALADTALLTVDLRELAEASAAQQWARVLALYEGPFLDGVHLDGSPEWEHWVLAQRQGAARLFEGACRNYSSQLERAAEWSPMEGVTARWLAQAPLDPLAAIRHLTAVARHTPADANPRARVGDAYEALVQRLVAEHASTPDATVTAHRDRLIQDLLRLERHTPASNEGMASPQHVLPAKAESQQTAPRLEEASTSPPLARRRFRLLLAAAMASICVLASIKHVLSSRPSTHATEWLTTASPEARRFMTLALQGGAAPVSRAEAIQLLERAVRLDSSFAMAHRTLALLWEGDGTKSAKVAAALTRAVTEVDRLTPYERESVLSSYHLLVTHDYVQAASHQRALLHLAPEDADGWHDLGMTYQYLGDNRRAAEAYQRALQRDRTSAATWVNLIDALFAAGERGQAAAAIDSMTLAIPGHPSLFSASARFHAASGNANEAERQARAYLAATATRPRSQGIGEMLLSRILWTQGRLDEGDDAVRRGIAHQLRIGDTVMALQEAFALAAASYWLRGSPARARQHVREALVRTPIERLSTADRPYLALATAQALAGAFADAERSLTRYEHVTPIAARARGQGAEALARGTLAWRRGTPAQAVPFFRQAQTFDCPVCGLPELGLAYAALGQEGDAESARMQYLRTPTLRRTDLLDALHRRRMESRVAKPTD